MHVMFFTLIVVAVIVATALLFVFWVVVTVLRALTRLLLGPGLRNPQTLESQRAPPGTRRCVHEGCRAINPVEARFCRRCGVRFEEPRRVPVRRAAIL